MKCSLDISNFLKRFLVFPILLFPLFLCIIHQRGHPLLSLLFSGFCWLYLSRLFFPWLFVKPPQTTTLPSCISFSLGWFWLLLPVQCYKPPSILLQAFCLPDLIPWIYLSPPLFNESLGIGFRSYLKRLWIFPTFFSLSLNLAIMSALIF